MTEFNVGDIVYLKDEFVEKHKKYSGSAIKLLPGQISVDQFGLAKDIAFTIVKANSLPRHLYITNFTESWGRLQGEGRQGILWNGKRCKTWCLPLYSLEKRSGNTVSLYELNRGL